LSPKTEADYQKVIRRAYPNLADLNAGAMPNVKDWPESVRKILRSALRNYWATKEQPQVGVDIAAKIPKLYGVKRKMQYPTDAEMTAFEAATLQQKSRLRPLLMLLARVGFRAKELLMLSREQVERGVVTDELFFEGKGGEEGSLPVSHVRSLLQDLLGSPAALPHSNERMRELMIASTGGPPRWEYVREILAAAPAKFVTQYNLLGRLVKKTAEDAGLDPKRWSPHKLRHGFASRMNSDGAPVATIQKALRHKNVQTTMRYVHASTKDVEKYMRR
jgi:integrase/recombinase XerD